MAYGINKRLKVEKFGLKEMTVYVAMDKSNPLFLNNMYCLNKLSPCNMFEKLRIMMGSVKRCAVVLVSSELFRVYVKGMESVKVFHNNFIHDVKDSIKIKGPTASFSIECDKEEIVRDWNSPVDKTECNNKSTFAYISIKNACLNEKNTQNGLIELLKVKQIIERLLDFYTCETVNSDLEYFIIRFDDPLKLVHFIDKLATVLDNIYLNPYKGKEKLVYSIGVSFGLFDKFYDHASSNNYSYCGIALNLCSRLAKVGESDVYVCKEFCDIVHDQLYYLNYEVVSVGEQVLKGFEKQEVFILKKCK